ncbi:hypothetical protein V5R04_09615 [Jonesiaceae bacterium BS-20]|uniref:Uncharacterized protein n=1 Tax=Jonesiaceae bacterium BS-20 TaxID=3120821 RepID=A0AAU7DS41_9MICO
MTEPTSATPVFDSGETATIASGMKIHAKLGRVVINEGHIGLLRENGDLIDSAPLSKVVLKKGLTYIMVPTLHVLMNGTKYLVNLSYEARIHAGVDDATAKDEQRRENAAFAQMVRQLGGQAKGL